MNGPKGKYAWTVTVGEKGQIVIPKQAREVFGIGPGDTLVLLGDEEKGLAIPPKTAFDQLIAAIFAPQSDKGGGVTVRRRYLDNLRWATVLLVLAYHVCYLFNSVGIVGNIPGAPNIPFCDWLAAAVYPWFMVLLFVVAGMSSRLALEKRAPREFLKERAVKLLIPNTLGLFVLHWVTGYLNIKMGGGLAYIPKAALYPVAAVSGTGPLWFAQMLFVFSVALLLLKRMDRKDTIWRWCGKLPLWLSVTVPPLLLWGASQIGNLPVLTMYRFGIYFTAFLLGYYLFSHENVMEALTKEWAAPAALAVCTGAGYLARWGGNNFTQPACLQSLLTNTYAWLTILTLLGLFRRWFDCTNSFCGYMTQVSFGLYVLHYPVFLGISHLLVEYLNLPAIANYLIVFAAGTALTFAACEAVRRIPVVRFLVLGQRKRG